MRYRHLLIGLLLAAAAAHAQNANEQPLFGEQPKSAATAEADRHFVESSVQAAGSPDAAARQELTRAWKNLKQGDIEVAIQGFNQAYLLDPKNAEVYWGLGVAMTQQGKFSIAVRMFGRALALAPDNPKLLADVGLSHARAAVGTTQSPVEQAQRLQAAMPWFDAAEKLDPNHAPIYANRAVALYLQGNYTEAWNNIDKAEALDKNSVDPALIKDLTQKLARPANAIAASPAPSAEVKTEAVATQQAAQPEALPAPAGKEVMPQHPGTAAAAIRKAQAMTVPQPGAPAAEAAVPTAPAPQPEPAQAAQPEAAPAPATEAPLSVQKVELAPAPAAEPVPLAQPEAAAPAAVPVEPPKADKRLSRKKVRVVSGQQKTVKGADKRACLGLSSNEAIHRCVYPKR